MRNPEQDIDLSLFEEMDDQEVFEYITWKYNEEVTEEVKKQVEKITRKEG